MNWLKDFLPTLSMAYPAFRGVLNMPPSELGLNTPNKLAAVSDEIVLRFQGIGPVKLQVVRDYCASIVEKRDSKRLDNVFR